MQVRKNETSQRILAKAFTRIAREGCASVSLRDIAAEAGVVLSQLNYYFKNREGLFSEVLRSMRQEYLAGVERELGGLGSRSEKIARLVRYNKELLISNKALYRAFLDFFNLAMWSDSFRAEMSIFLYDISDAISRQIEEEASDHDGQASRISSTVLTKMVLGTTFGIAMQYLMDPDHEDVLEGLDILEGLV
jgi:AcrR family transcriptional regulator